jgi:F-box protein 3
MAGEGVVGQFPLLRAGEPEAFVYTSCTPQDARRGFMDGTFRFVEGSIQCPSGPEWEVACPRFKLEVPTFVY